MKTSIFGYSKREVNEAVDSMQNQIDVLTSRITNLSSELLAKTDMSAQGEEQIKSLTDRLSKAERDRVNLQNEIAVLKEYRAEQSADENSVLNDRIRTLEDTVTSVSKELSDARAKCARLEAAADGNVQKGDYDSLKEELNRLKLENKRLSESLASAEHSAVSYSDGEIGRLDAENSALRIKAESLGEALAMSRSALSCAQSELAEKSKELEELKTRAAVPPEDSVYADAGRAEAERRLANVGRIYLAAYEDAEQITNDAAKRSAEYFERINELINESGGGLKSRMKKLEDSRLELERKYVEAFDIMRGLFASVSELSGEMNAQVNSLCSLSPAIEALPKPKTKFMF